MLPVSRLRYVVLAGVLVLAAAIYAIVVATGESNATSPQGRRDAALAVALPAAPDDAPADPTAAVRAEADELVTAGKLEAALDVLAKARRRYPDRAVLPYEAGKLYFAKLWWVDGIKSFRDAIKLDPSYRTDPDLIKLAIRGFVTTPQYDERLGAFVSELGDAAREALDETARTHPNPQVRARAAEQLQRGRR
jgi:tetratricopeptide (TPR) repeat protein